MNVDATILDDRETVELLRGRPDLLAIADAVRVTQLVQRRHLPLRRLGLLVAAVAVAAAIALVVPWQGRGGFTARALAALGTGQVIHIVSTADLQATVVDLTTGTERPLTERSEVWFDATRGLERTVSTVDGRVVDDEVQTPQNNHKPELNPALAGFVTDYRTALSDGSAGHDGTGTVDGRPVEWLRFPEGAVEPPGASEPSDGTQTLVERVALDEETLKPLLLEAVVGGKVVNEVRLTLVETLNPDQVDWPQTTTPPQQHSATLASEQTVTPADAAAALGGQLLWLGDASGDLSLSTVTLFSESDGPAAQRSTTVSPGVRIVYRGSAGNVVLQESEHPQTLSGFIGPEMPAPASGSMLLSRAFVPRYWLGLLRENGLYVSIEAPTKSELLDAARGLRPLSG